MTKSLIIPFKPVVNVETVVGSTIFTEKHNFTKVRATLGRRLGSNRPLNQSRIKSIAGSIKKYGFITFMNIIETRALNKERELQRYFVDGEHRLVAVSELRLPFNYQVLAFKNESDDTEANVIELMAALNSVSKSWSPTNYVDAYKTLELPMYDSYRVFANLQESSSLSASTILCILTNEENFTNADPTGFYKGRFKIRARKEYSDVLEALLQVRDYIPTGAKCESEYIVALRDYALQHGVTFARISQVILNLAEAGQWDIETLPSNKVQFRNKLRETLDIKFS